MLTGRTGKYANVTRFIPIHAIYDALNEEQHRILLSCYCMTGCDTISSFHGHGKRTAFKVMMTDAASYIELSHIAEDTSMFNAMIMCARRYIAALYGYTSNSLNDVRCKMAGKKVAGKKLPPTDNTLS